jgi:hypothetical protein
MAFVRKAVYSLPIPSAVQEMILEGLRLAWFGALSALLTFLISRVQELPNPEMWAVLFTFVARLIDKWKHETDKETKTNGASVGIAGF